MTPPTAKALEAARLWLNDNEADLTSAAWSGLPESLAFLLDTFAGEEREAAAKVADGYKEASVHGIGPLYVSGLRQAAIWIAEAIRSRTPSTNPQD